MPPLPDTFPHLSTSRLDLVEINQDHQQDLFMLLTEPRVTEFYPVISLEQPGDLQPVIDIFARRFAEKQGIRWGIQLKDSERLIGIIGYNSFTAGHRASIVFALAPEHWHKGLATEAIGEVIRFGFGVLEVNRIEAEVRPGNTTSEKALRGLGFQHEGLLRQWMLWEGKHQDINMYALLKSDR